MFLTVREETYLQLLHLPLHHRFIRQHHGNHNESACGLGYSGLIVEFWQQFGRKRGDQKRVQSLDRKLAKGKRGESGKKSKQEDIDDYKKRKATVEFPDGHRQQYNFQELEEAYNSLKADRTKVSAELGEVLKPVTEASNQASAYISDHMVDLTPTQIDGLKKKAADWDNQIVQINVPEANIVDRCESCHMNAREPIRVTAAVMTLKGEKEPDEYAQAFTSHPEPELLKTHDPDKFGCSISLAQE